MGKGAFFCLFSFPFLFSFFFLLRKYFELLIMFGNAFLSTSNEFMGQRCYRYNNFVCVFPPKGAGELESRVQVVSLLMLHLSVVLWFYHCGLLSHSPTEDIEECHVPFPADLLCRIYKNR